MKRFAAFDIDGTLIRWQLYHATTDSLARLGHLDDELHKRIKDARMAWKNRQSGRSFAEYEKEVIAIYEEVLTGLTKKQSDEAIEAVFNEYKDQVYTYTRDLLVQLKKRGYLLFAISGSQTEIVGKIAARYGFDDYVGTVYEHAAGRFTGGKTIGSARKDLTLKSLIKKYGAQLTGSIAVGDSKSDIAMLELVETPIAFNPEKELFEHARKMGWDVVVERKNLIYELKEQDGRYVLAETSRR